MQTEPYRTTRDLFSRTYLEERLPDTAAWKGVDETELRAVHGRLTDSWTRERPTTPTCETDREESFVCATFRALGIPFEAIGGANAERPDYALFASPTAARRSRDRGGGGEDRYGDAVAVADVECREWRPDDCESGDVECQGWRRDARDSGGGGRDCRHPGYRMHCHLRETPVRWAVLTNGRVWRLYHAATSHRLDSHYEVDLPSLLEGGNREAFRYFYLFFRREAFLEGDDGDCFLDEVRAQSRALARDQVAALRNDVAAAVASLANGFLHRSGNDLDRGDLDQIYGGSLVYTFRLLFALAAEADGRTPRDGGDDGSLHALARNAVGGRPSDGSGERTSDGRTGNDLWNRVETRLAALDRGARPDPAAPTDGDGLFCPGRDETDGCESRFLADHRVGDATLAGVLDRLTVHGEETPTAGYASLPVGRLGDVYGGLLEREPAVADEPLTVVDGTHVPAGEGDSVAVATGEVYLTTGDGERKAAGAYYTPARVVEYVVEETLAPLVEEVRTAAGTDGRGDAAQFASRVLDRDVLDPAMGSGRFLTGVVDYLTQAIVGAQERQAARRGRGSIDRERGVDRIRRQVARRCVYGVDLDPVAVEVAKLSLWLQTAGADEPAPSFDHLRTGNALVGSRLAELDSLASESDGGVPHAESERGDSRVDAGSDRQRLEAMANVHTAEAFGLDGVPSDAYGRMAAADDASWDRLVRTPWFREAQRRARDDQYLHWELEFPGVYGEGADAPGGLRSTGRPAGGTKEAGRATSRGFDAVVGNPPWVATAGRTGASATMDRMLRSYLTERFRTAEGQFDLYAALYEQSIRQSSDGRVGIVVPDSILAREQAEPIRAFVLENTSLSAAVRLGATFDGVETGAVALVSGSDSNGDRVRCADVTAGASLPSPTYESIPVHAFRREEAKRFLIYLDEATRSVLASVDDRPRLGEYVEVSRGEELGKRADVLHETPRPDTRPIAPGSAVVRYGIDDDELRYVERDDVGKPERNYEGPKLLFRQTGESVVGTYDADGLATIKSAYNLHTHSGSAEESKHLLGVLNSSVLAFYHHYRHAAYRSVFPQINQSSFEAFPVAMADGPDGTVVDSVERLLASTAERVALDLRVADHLGTYEPGTRLADLGTCRPAVDVARTRLTSTTDEWPNLRLGSVAVDAAGDSTVVSATVRYKPTDRTTATDGWGYAETDPVPALEFDGVGREFETLLEAFVPHAVEEGDGFADFRANATATTSPLDRLRALRLPRLADVRGGLRRFVAQRDRAAKLDREIERHERRIDERVCDLYGLTDEERALVREEFGRG